jgi:hypothetical protein
MLEVNIQPWAEAHPVGGLIPAVGDVGVSITL